MEVGLIMFRSRTKTYSSLFGIFLICIIVTTVILRAHADPVQPQFNHFLSTNYDNDGQYDDNAPPGALVSGAEQELYSDRAYPGAYVTYGQAIQAYNSFQSMARLPMVARGQAWHLVGPVTGNVPGPVTYTGATTTVSGRVTAIAISNSCDAIVCRVWVGAAGGGIWTTDDGLAPVPTWHASSNGLGSNAIGSIVFDPNDSTRCAASRIGRIHRWWRDFLARLSHDV